MECMGYRSWLISLLVAPALVGIVVLVAVVVNSMVGRYIHWDRIAVGAPVAVLVLAIALRQRWM